MSARKPAKLRLFVWTEFSPDYTSGLAFAIGTDETDARAQITKARGYDVYEWGKLTIHPVSRKVAYQVSGGG